MGIKLRNRFSALLPNLSGEQAHRARILLMAGLIFAAVGAVFLVIQVVLWILPPFPPAPAGDLLADLAVVFFGAATIWLVRSGRIRQATWLVLGCFLGISILQIYLDGNPATNTAGAMALLLFVALAMVLLDRRAPWLAFITAAVALIGMHILSLAGHLSPSTRRDPLSQVLFSILTWLTIGGTIAGVVYSTMNVLRNQARTLRHNITDLHRADSVLRQQTATLEALLNAPLDTVALLGPDGRLLRINESGARRLGATQEELIGRNVYEILPADVAHERKVRIDRVFQTGEAAHFEDRRGGKCLANSVYPVFGEHGEEVTSVAIFASDVTERRQAEDALRERTHALGERVKELRCLYGISRLVETPDTSLEEILQGTVDLIPPAWQYPEVTCARVVVRGEEFRTDDFAPVPWRQEAEIVVENEPIGTVVVRYLEERPASDEGPFLAEERSLIDAIAERLGSSIERRRRQDALRQRAAQLALLNDIGDKIAAVLDLDIVLDSAVRLVRENFGYHHVGLFILDRGEEQLVMRARAGDFAHLFAPDHRLEMGEGMVGWVAYSGSRLMANDVDQEPRYVNLYGDEIPTRSELAVPIRIGGEIIGVLDVQSPRLNAFEDDDVMVMETLTDQVAVAIENARLYEQTRTQAREASTLLEIANAVNSTLEPEQVLKELLWRAAEACGANRCTIILIGEQGETLRPLMSQFSSGQMDLKAWRLFAEEAIPRFVSEVHEALKVIQERRPVLIPDVADSSMWPWIEPFEVGSVLLVPLVIQDRVIGIMALDNVETGQTFTAAQVNLAMTIGAQAATALENSRLFQAERRQRELTEALEEAAAVVSSTLELDRVLDRILEQVERVVAGDAFNVMLVEGDMARIARWRGYEPSEASGSVAAVSTPIASCPHLQRMVGGDSVVVPDVTADPNWGGEEAPRRWRSYVGAPIVVTGLTVGFLNVIGTDLAQFGPEDAQRLEIFARHAATAIENAQLYQEVRNHVDQLEERVQERTAQIQAQYARLEAILSSTGDGVIVTDDEGGILQVNRVAETWLTQTLPADEVKQLRETTRDLVARVGERPEAVLELESIDLQITAAPIREPAGEGRAVVALHDVSHLKELERLKSRFVSNVSHELRTPITTIVLYAKLIRNHPESLEEYIDPLVREAEREAELVENILQISRLDAGRLEFDPQPAGLNRLVAESIDSLQMLARNKGITLVDQFAQPEPVAWADPERLQQVLNNLLENAIHYTPEGGRVAVSTGRRVTEGGTWVTVTFEDTGIGIPEDERPHIFERFYRGERPRREQISGSGLGLAIVQEIVELHGGRVTVESEVGSGSTFTVWLPPSE